MTTATNRLAASLFGVLSLTVTAGARADQKQVCSAAYDATQTLRDEGMLLDAKRQALVCSDVACPAFIHDECAQWLIDIDALMPTVLFKAVDESGADIPGGVRVMVDGRLLPEWFRGKPIPVDPGEHHVLFELDGAEANKQTILVRKGEKNRKIVASFKRQVPVPAPPPSPPQSTTTPSSPPAPVDPPPVEPPVVLPPPDGVERKALPGRSIPPWVWIPSGIGVTALAADLAYGLSVSSSVNETIDKSRRDRDRGVLIALTSIGVLGVAVGALALGVGAPASAPKAVSFAPFVSPAGGGVLAGGLF